MFTRRRASAVSERAQRAKRTERSGSLPRFEIPGEFPFCKYCFCFLVLAWTFLALFYLSSLYALPVHARKGLCWEVFSSQTLSRRSKIAQDAPWRAQDAPRRLQDAPRRAQDAPKTPQRRAKTRPRRAKTRQDAPKTRLRSIFNDF